LARLHHAEFPSGALAVLAAGKYRYSVAGDTPRTLVLLIGLERAPIRSAAPR
jgi:hypothetical protein